MAKSEDKIVINGYVTERGGVVIVNGPFPKPKAERIKRLCEAAPDLLAGLKEEHGWDDPLHTTAQPDCWKCAAIARATNREET